MNKRKVLSKEHKHKLSLAHLNKKLSEEHKKNISKSLIGKNTWMLGSHHSEERKEKIKRGNLGKIISKETRQRISIANKGRHLSELTKNKIRINHFGGVRIGSKFPKELYPNKGMRNKHQPETQKEKMRRPITEEHRQKLIEVRKKQIMKPWTEKSKQKLRETRAKQKNCYSTSIEVKIQNFLNQLGLEYFTHRYMKEIEHSYQCDIFIPSKNLVIECDGNYWHSYPTGKEIDHIRTKELIEKGFKVLRLWEVEINKISIKEFKYKLNET